MSTSYGRRDGPVITFAECPMIIDALEKTANDFLCAPGAQEHRPAVGRHAQAAPGGAMPYRALAERIRSETQQP